MAATAEKLSTFDAWGMASVSNEQITVILSAIALDGRTINRTVRDKSDHPLGFDGTALVAVDLVSGMVAVHEIGKTAVLEHPDVKRVLKSAVGWLRKSAGR